MAAAASSTGSMSCCNIATYSQGGSHKQYSCLSSAAASASSSSSSSSLSLYNGRLPLHCDGRVGRLAAAVSASSSSPSSKEGEEGDSAADGKKKKENNGGAEKQSLLSSITEALDFSQTRSQRDAELLEDARFATRQGEKMSREQYGALRRKIGGTYRDFFKDSIDVDGEYVEEGWVDKTCRFCKKDTTSEPRTVDKFGRYAHVACLEKSKSGNVFTRLFGG